MRNDKCCGDCEWFYAYMKRYKTGLYCKVTSDGECTHPRCYPDQKYKNFDDPGCGYFKEETDEYY